MDNNDSNIMSKNVEMEELDTILKHCKNNKSPGLDGLPYEFFKAVWSTIGSDFLKIIQCQLDRIAIVDSNKVGATRLLPKVIGTPQVDELRPITLLNTDYKILAKLLVNRMKPVLPQVITSSQLCSVANRNILFGINNILSSIHFVKERRQRACILSLDFFKAYDRVMLDYLLKVMRKMNFSSLFCSWIRMMHEGAMTKFILSSLTEAIRVDFSIRQGDPLSMILYILFIEPFLLALERNLIGLNVAGISQKVEGYCDDVNILTSDDTDLVRVDEIVTEFEAISGAILSRTNKCKIMGLRSWKDRINWPLNYLKSEKELKIFGIFITPSYTSIVKRNWDYRFEKFNNCVLSWTSKFLPSLSSKIEVLRTFALSRIYYVASILPISKTMIKKMEGVMGKFIWNNSGWLLRVSLSELKNKPDKGGLNCVCLYSMCKSLLLSQFLRLMKCSYPKSIAHVAYWLGDTLDDLLPGLDMGSHPQNIPEYFALLESLIIFGKIENIVEVGTWRRLTNKMIYTAESKNFPIPKVEQDSGEEINYKLVCKTISSSLLHSSEKDIAFLLVHNKLPTKERIFRVGLAVNPYCPICPSALECDSHHIFCSCLRVRNVWQSVRDILEEIIGETNITDLAFINFSFPSSPRDNEAVWLIGNYLYSVWHYMKLRSMDYVQEEELFGYLRFKYKTDQQGARVRLDGLPGIS